MRRLICSLLLLSLVLSPVAYAANEVLFDENPEVTVDPTRIEPAKNGFGGQFYFYGAVGIVATYALASYKIKSLGNLNTALWSATCAVGSFIWQKVDNDDKED